MRSDWPEVTMIDLITGDTIRRDWRPVIPRAGEIVAIGPELHRWRVSDVVHDGDVPDMITVYLIPILELQEVPSGDNSGD